MKSKRRKPFACWRLKADTPKTSVTIHDDGDVDVYGKDKSLPFGNRPLGGFDEFAIGGGLSGDPCPIHVEAMSDSSLSVSLGFALFAVWVRGDKVFVRLQEGVYEPKTGMIRPHGWKAKGRKR